MKQERIALFIFISISTAFILTGQPDSGARSLKSCIAYALENSTKVREARLEKAKTEQQIQEMKSAILPQARLDAGLDYNFELPTELAPGALFGMSDGDVGIQFGKPINASMGIEVRQLAYSKAFSIGREGAGKLREASALLLQKEREEVAHEVARMYYQCLIVNEKRKLLLANLAKVEGLRRLMEKQYQNGFVKKIDVDRLKVAQTNLEAQLNNLGLQYGQLLEVLKYKMAMPLDTPIALQDTIPEGGPAFSELEAEGFDLSQKTEINLLNLKGDLLQVEERRLQAGYYPKIFVEGQLGFNLLGDNISEIGSRDYWYSAALLGVKLEMPIFDGFQRRAQIEQARIAQQQQQEGLRFASQSLQLQYNSSLQKLRAHFNNLQSLEENQEVAEEIFTVMQKRYTEGIEPVTGLLNAETAMREAQANYLTTLLEYELAKLDLLHARGELLAYFQLVDAD